MNMEFNEKEWFKAVRENDIATIKEYIDLDFNINTKDKEGITALMQACFSDNFEMVELLLAYGADIYLKNNSGSTALDFAKNNINQSSRILILLEVKIKKSIFKKFELACDVWSGYAEIDFDPISNCDTYKMGLTNLKYDINSNVLTLYLRRPGLFIGKAGSNIKRVEEYLDCKINIIYVKDLADLGLNSRF